MVGGKVNFQNGPASRQRGQIAMAAVIFFLLVILVILGTYGTLAVGQLNTASQIINSKRALSNAESAIEDGVYRINNALNINDTGIGGNTQINLNGFLTTANIAYTIQPDGRHLNTLTSQANLGGYYRSSKITYLIPDGDQYIGVVGALQAGYGGIKFAGNVSIQSKAGAGRAEIVSNGSVIGVSGTPWVDGSVLVTRSIGSSTAPWFTKASLGFCGEGMESTLAGFECIDADKDGTPDNPSHPGGPTNNAGSFAVGYNSSGWQQGAFSFSPSFTSDIVKIKIFMRRVGNPANSIPIKLVPNIKYLGYDRPDRSGTPIGSASLQTNTLPALSAAAIAAGQTGSAFGWAETTLTIQYDPIIAGDKYWIVFEPGVVSAVNYYRIGHIESPVYPDGRYDRIYMMNHEGWYDGLYSMSDPQYVRSSNFSEISFGIDTGKQIGFQIFLGEEENIIDYTLLNGINRGKISGNAKAEKMVAVGVEKHAYYNHLSLVTNAPNSNETVAGGEFTPLPKVFGSTCQMPVSDNPTAGHTTINDFCRCASGPSGADDTYCHRLDPIVPYDENDSYAAMEPPYPIFGQGPPFSYSNLKILYDMAQGLGCRYVDNLGNIQIGACNNSSTYTYNPSANAATTTIDYGFLNGNVTLDGSNTNNTFDRLALRGLDSFGKCLYHRTGNVPGEVPPDEDTSETDPCYVLWITGNLVIRGDSQITGEGGHLRPCNSVGNMASIYVVVEGTIDIMESAKAYGFPHSDFPPPGCAPESGKSGMFLISYSGKTSNAVGGNAISTSQNPKVSTLFAFRGGIYLQDNIKLKAVAGHQLYFGNNASIMFEEGLRNPFSVSGGKQATGSDIREFREIE